MQTIGTIEAMSAWSRENRRAGRSIGFVPTMGCLHAGHISLARHSLAHCDRTAVSIFVNPKQFGPSEDFDAYPRQPGADHRLLEENGVDVLFMPEQRAMYPEGFRTAVTVEEITRRLCGGSRPDFFRGVCTVVLKLLNIVRPDKAFFGEKDWQQLTVIRAMTRDLNLDVDIVGLPIVREPDGVAMSSRNLYLSVAERQSARRLSQALRQAKMMAQSGETDAAKVKSAIRQLLEEDAAIRVDYVSVCDAATFAEKERITGQTLIALAAQVGKARLIDNCIVEGV